MKKFRSTEEAILSCSARALIAVGSNSSTLDDLLDGPELQSLRRTLSHLLLGYFKHKKAIDDTLNRFISKAPDKETAALLAAALTQAITQQRMAPEAVVNVAVDIAKKQRKSGFVNAVLRKSLEALREKPLPISPEEVLPHAVCSRWAEQFGQETTGQLTEAFLSTPEFTFRLEKHFADSSFDYSEAFTVCEKFPFGKAPAQVVLNSEEFKSGRLYIQDPAAALAVSLAPEGSFSSILDLCAAPGGKSLMLLEKYPDVVEFTAFDRSKKRQQLTRRNFDLRGIKHPAVCNKALIDRKWDMIFIDAPCTNTGVFRRRPDALWRFSESELAKTAAIQRELLDFAVSHLESRGVIVYSTCSIEPEEDELQIRDFLARHSGFELLREEKLLPAVNHDGAFAAVMKLKDR